MSNNEFSTPNNTQNLHAANSGAANPGPVPPSNYTAAHRNGASAKESAGQGFYGTGQQQSANAYAAYREQSNAAGSSSPCAPLPSKAKKQLIALTCSLSLVCGILGGVAGGALSNAADGSSQAGGIQQQGQMQSPDGQNRQGDGAQSMPEAGAGGNTTGNSGTSDSSDSARNVPSAPNSASDSADGSGPSSNGSSTSSASNASNSETATA